MTTDAVKKPIEANTAGKSGGITENRKRVRAVRGKAPCDDGVGQLRVAADQWVGWNSDTIANALADNAVNGDLASAKTLVTLAEGKKISQEGGKTCGGTRLTELWEGESQCMPDEDANSERGTGNSEVGAALK